MLVTKMYMKVRKDYICPYTISLSCTRIITLALNCTDYGEIFLLHPSYGIRGSKSHDKLIMEDIQKLHICS